MSDTPIDDEATVEPIAKFEAATMREFLEECPPNQFREVGDLFEHTQYEDLPYGPFLTTPEIELHCDSETCLGKRIFRSNTAARDLTGNRRRLFFVLYLCSNCRRCEKVYSVYVASKNHIDGIVQKIGELPPFGPPTPSRLLELLGENRKAFLCGRRCENQGLGVGAFAYYRRVVENQKNEILDEIIKVSRVLKADHGLIEALEQAKKERQFLKAMTMIKGGLPQILLIHGHNPLTLLHDALSEGLHGKSDEECLDLAHSIRTILTELSESIGQALKDKAEVKAALGVLFKKSSLKTADAKESQ